MGELGTGGPPSWHRRACEIAGPTLYRQAPAGLRREQFDTHSEFPKGLAAGIDGNT